MNTVTTQRSPARGIPSLQRQRGVVLIVSLILLMVLTLIGVTAMQTSTLEERMAGNAWDKQRAFQAAEAALRAAENRLDTSVREVEDNTDGLIGFGGELVTTTLGDEPWGTDINNPDLTGWAEFDQGLDDMQLGENPHYIIHLLARGVAAETTVDVLGNEIERGNVYRVTAIGWGSSPASQVVLQSFYLANN